MQYVLVVSIGPVQEFIAAARKTRDLWFGSQMLSDISLAVAQELKKSGAELIFPPDDSVSGGSADGKRPSVANKIVAVVHSDPGSAAQRAKEAAGNKLKSFWAEAERVITQREASGLIDKSEVDEQIEGFLEFYAAWWPIESEGGYKTALEQADLLLVGRKALRDFRQSTVTVGLPKSSLDGGRQTVLKEGHEDQRFRLGIKPTEQLDSISLIKRVVDPRRFVSVVRVAVDPFIRRLEAEASKELSALLQLADGLKERECPAVQKFSRVDQYKAFPYDTALFFEGTTVDSEVESWMEKDEGNRQAVEQFQKALEEACRKLDVGEIPSYLAVLHADGDRMGKAIRTLETSDEHRRLSSALVDFAVAAGEIVADNHGVLVYSGGDDVLAFLPLDTVLECAKRLAEEFSNRVQPLFQGGQEVAPTLSVGVSIAHYGEHLGELVEWSRRAERAAKVCRDSLAVALHTRSAGPEAVTVVHTWKEDPVWRFKRWVDLHRLEALPDRAPFELRELHRELKRYAESQRGTQGAAVDLGELVKQEVERILKRKRAERGAAELSEDLVGFIVDEISTDSSRALDALDTVVNEMLIARRLAGVEDVVGTPKTNMDSILSEFRKRKGTANASG
ncbi:MAG: type III-B CRISPR-associated protein Cas10/Cmr2 [Armatimonadota bacterium]